MALFSEKTFAGKRGEIRGESRGVKQPLPQTLGPLDLSSEGIALLNEKGQITEINTQALRLLQCTLPSVTGRDFWDAVPEPISDQHQASTGMALDSSDRHSFVEHNKFEDNWLEFTFRHQLSGYIVNVRDVTTAQKLRISLEASEQQNRLIFEINPNPMWVFDASSLRILAVNRAAVEFYGIAHSKFLGVELGSLFPDGEGASILGAIRSTRGTRWVPQLCKQKKKDGQLVLVELACSRISWDDHPSVLVSLADVTERHLADRTLRRENAELELSLANAQRELKAITRDLTAFTYGLSNDLQGPLHAVNGFAAILTERYAKVLDEPGRHYVSRIQASTRQLAKLVGDLRTLVQLPQLSEVTEEVDVASLCGIVIDDLRAGEPGRIVVVEVEAGLTLVADKRLLVTALACMLENAWKFTSKKPEGWIRVALMPGKSPGQRVLQVSDNGTGFDAVYTDKLFAPFQRLHSSADFAGNGLGLAIVKRVAERHGGSVWAETNPTGASFYMAFPQHQSGADGVRTP